MFRNYYSQALQAKQDEIDGIAISSYDKNFDEVDARFVNIKILDGNQFIFFTNYNSPKSKQFNDRSQVACLIFWSSINLQIRIKATIKKLPFNISDNFFKKRALKKNALAISSMQSEVIDSYESVESNYIHTLNTNDLKIRPSYWGGYQITPYYFEFWTGHELRLNKRDAFTLKNKTWKHNFLQP